MTTCPIVTHYAAAYDESVPCGNPIKPGDAMCTTCRAGRIESTFLRKLEVSRDCGQSAEDRARFARVATARLCELEGITLPTEFWLEAAR